MGGIGVRLAAPCHYESNTENRHDSFDDSRNYKGQACRKVLLRYFTTLWCYGLHIHTKASTGSPF